jgi:BolA protein
MKQRIEKKLNEALKPKFLEVENNSAMHHGHLGDDGSGETHFAIIIESEELKKLNKVQAHRKVNELVKHEFRNGMHALEIKII